MGYEIRMSGHIIVNMENTIKKKEIAEKAALANKQKWLIMNWMVRRMRTWSTRIRIYCKYLLI